MVVKVVAAGYGKWGEYTGLLLDSLRRHEPSAEIVIVDNGSPEPYPAEPEVVHLPRNEPYAKAMNHGVAQGRDDWQWLVALNNDVLCSGPFIDTLAQLPPGAIVGPQMGRIIHYEFLLGWCICIPRYIWDSIGPFDEDYPRATFEDIDYSYRARLAGYRVLQMWDLPFIHFDAGTRRDAQINRLHIWAGAMFERKHGIPAPLTRYSPQGLVDSGWL